MCDPSPAWSCVRVLMVVSWSMCRGRLHPIGSISEPVPARMRVLLVILSSLVRVAQPYGSMQEPHAARTRVPVFIVASRGEGVRSSQRVDAAAASRPGVCGGSHRSLLSRAGSAVRVQVGAGGRADAGHRQPSGSREGPSPARSRVVVRIAASVQPLGSTPMPLPAGRSVVVVISVSFSRWGRRRSPCRRGCGSRCSSFVSDGRSAVWVEEGRGSSRPRVDRRSDAAVRPHRSPGLAPPPKNPGGG